MSKPLLRNISARTLRIDGEQMIVLEDPEHFGPNTLCVPYNEPMVFILTLLDGNHSVLDIQSAFMKRFGTMLMSERINEILDALDKNYFLRNERFQNRRDSIVRDFRESPVRKSCMEGVSYPGNIEQLEILMKSMQTAGKKRTEDKTVSSRKIRGVIAPHIDFMRGGKVYGSIYNALPRTEKPETVVIFGTVHSPNKSLLIPTKKSFSTPLGELAVDEEILSELENRLGADYLYKDEFSHRGEHSIEFQILWLQYLYQHKKGVRIVPILCSSFEPFIRNGKSPSEDKEYTLFLDSLREILEEKDRNYLMIAGADLSHIGPSFGDESPLTPEFMDEVQHFDKRMLKSACSAGSEAFFHSVAENGDKYRVCGLPPIYAMLYMLRESQGEVLDYEQSLDPQKTTSVSFAGIVFY